MRDADLLDVTVPLVKVLSSIVDVVAIAGFLMCTWWLAVHLDVVLA